MTNASCIYQIDLDPDETDDLNRIVERAQREGAFLHIELRKITEVVRGGDGLWPPEEGQ